jgi:hypothetical protein
LPALRLADRSAEDVRAYLGSVLGRWQLKDWQVGQLVDAVRILYEDFVKVPWASDFPWTAWKVPHLNFPDVLQRYGTEASPRHAVIPQMPAADRPQGLKAIDEHREIFDRLRSEIRIRHYSLRSDVSTTMIYTHVMNRPGLVVKSPADF